MEGSTMVAANYAATRTPVMPAPALGRRLSSSPTGRRRLCQTSCVMPTRRWRIPCRAQVIQHQRRHNRDIGMTADMLAYRTADEMRVLRADQTILGARVVFAAVARSQR
jgi:hypothetical protein